MSFVIQHLNDQYEAAFLNQAFLEFGADWGHVYYYHINHGDLSFPTLLAHGSLTQSNVCLQALFTGNGFP